MLREVSYHHCHPLTDLVHRRGRRLAVRADALIRPSIGQRVGLAARRQGDGDEQRQEYLRYWRCVVCVHSANYSAFSHREICTIPVTPGFMCSVPRGGYN